MAQSAPEGNDEPVHVRGTPGACSDAVSCAGGVGCMSVPFSGAFTCGDGTPGRSNGRCRRAVTLRSTPRLGSRAARRVHDAAGSLLEAHPLHSRRIPPEGCRNQSGPASADGRVHAVRVHQDPHRLLRVLRGRDGAVQGRANRPSVHVPDREIRGGQAHAAGGQRAASSRAAGLTAWRLCGERPARPGTYQVMPLGCHLNAYAL
jgi:hypothetical protein